MKEEIANMMAPQQLIRPIARWPFYALLGGAMFCLLASSTCHLLSCHIMLRLDYAGIAALILLPSGLLFVYVSPLLLQPVPQPHNHRPRSGDCSVLPTPGVPEP
jgi:hypothetical protein